MDLFDKALEKSNISSEALKEAIRVIISTKFPDNLHKQVEHELPWLKLLDSCDDVEGLPAEAIVKTYLTAIIGE